MCYPSEGQFIKLAQKYNVVAVYKEAIADTETPVSAYLKLNLGENSYLLESKEGEEKIARFSFIGHKPFLVFKSKKNNIFLTSFTPSGLHKERKFISPGPLEELKKIARKFRPAACAGLPRFFGGFVGYIGYDMARFFEPCLAKNKVKDELKLADMYFMLTRNLIIFDHRSNRAKIIVNVFLKDGRKDSEYLKNKYSQALSEIETVEAKLKAPFIEGAARLTNSRKITIKSNMTREAFKKMVRKAKGYIRRGEIIQVVLSQRFSAPINKGPFEIYRKLRSLNPSPYMYYLNFKDAVLAGSSPEMFVRCEDGRVDTRPIAGTRVRGKNDADDLKLSRNLLSDKKELAEHLMLVDLGRNDLGRVCEYGTVRVNEWMGVEKYSHVMHIVSNVTGKLRRDKDVFDVVRATFPAGTVSGAPKVRAMEIIDKLEKTSRGPYAGCVGYFSFSGNLDTCITIRTIVVKSNTAYIQAGAGIVADSDPDKEYRETVNKAKAQMEALA